jgi:hypothetical protein
MLAPPQRRAADRLRKAKQRAREKNGVALYRLALSNRAVSGLILKFILEGKLSERQALDPRKVENAITNFVEEEDFVWSR